MTVYLFIYLGVKFTPKFILILKLRIGVNANFEKNPDLFEITQFEGQTSCLLVRGVIFFTRSESPSDEVNLDVNKIHNHSEFIPDF